MHTYTATYKHTIAYVCVLYVYVRMSVSMGMHISQ